MAQRRSGKGRGKKRALGKRAGGAQGAAGGQARPPKQFRPLPPAGAAGEPAATGEVSGPRRSR